MTTRSKFFELERSQSDLPDRRYAAQCWLCLWAGEFMHPRAAREAFVAHECLSAVEGLPESAEPGWRTQAECRDGIDPEAFYDFDRYPEAIAACASCPVRSSCLHDALLDERNDALFWGVRGGLLPEERAVLVGIQREAESDGQS